ncbi:MAG: fibrobacter succinogenes major paralogous domain-containing protein, partial [Bacteroidota bacterium]
MIHKQSIKTADLDSITFRRPANPNGINIAGPNVTDIDGNTYQSVTNCGLTFTKQNLNVSKYSDGTPIPQVTDPTEWANLTTGAWCYYNNDPANGAVYGKLYNWYAVAGIYDAASLANPALRKKLAPTGWHIPTEAEWTQLTDCLGGQNVAGGKMKSTGTLQAGTGLWQEPNTDATNESGFSGLPAGYRGIDGTFNVIGFY